MKTQNMIFSRERTGLVTRIRRREPVGEDTLESEKKAAEKSEKSTEQKSGVQSQKIADDSEEAAKIWINFKKSQEKILTEIANLTRDFKNEDPYCSIGFQVSESSNRYMITGRIDPFLKHQIKVNFSEDEKYIIVDATHEHSCGHCITSHQVVRKFRIDDKYNLYSMQHHITDNCITITIEAKHQSFWKREKVPEVQVSRKKKGKYVKIADRDLDMIATPEGEFLPRYVVERTTIDPEVYQRKIEIPPDLNFPEINEAYVVFRDDEFEPCPEFKRQIDEMSEKRTKEILAEREKRCEEEKKNIEEKIRLEEKTRLATSQSSSVPEDTDTSIRREKPLAEDGMKSEKKAAETPVESQLTDDLKEEGYKEENVDKKKSEEALTKTTLVKVKRKEEKGLKVEKKADAVSEEAVPEIPAKASKQRSNENEKTDDKDSREISKPPTDEGDKTEITHSIKCSDSRGETVWIEIELEQKAKKDKKPYETKR